jgi:CDGSH-type Zn-finger protein
MAQTPKIKVRADGTPYETRNRVTLCRCGASARKPFCDGRHLEARFDDGDCPPAGRDLR